MRKRQNIFEILPTVTKQTVKHGVRVCECGLSIRYFRKGVAMNSNSVSTEIEKYIARVVERRNRDGVLSIEECQSILEYAAESKSDAVFGIGYYYFAENYWFQGDTEQTMHCLTECTKCFRAAKMHEFLARTYNMMGAVSDSRDNKVVALNYYYTGLQFAERYQLDYVLGMIETNIAYILVRMKHFREAAEHYERAIESYRQSEDNLHRNHNLAACMLHCGSCYLRIGEKDKAYLLSEQIQKMRKKQPGKSYPDIEIKIFQGECLAAQGKREEALQCVEEVFAFLDRADSLDEITNSLTNVAELLLYFEAYDELEKLFEKADALGLEKETVLSMDMYPYRSEYLLHKNRTEEYIRYTEQYFSAYEKDRMNSKQVTARVMELQDRLRSMEKEQEKMRASNRKLEALALYDSLTNLANRTLINEHVSQKFEEAQSSAKIFGVELLDIDFFKRYNDTYGHLAGDACIEAVASVLRELEDDRIFCGRYGGDEFVVIYSDMTAEEIEEAACRIQDRVRDKKIPHENSECCATVTVSQGIFIRIPSDENREWDFNSMADIALYRAKREGRNRYHIETGFLQR